MTNATQSHRAAVGGLWHEIGRLQFQFLVDRGLQPDHHLLDIGCGCLRAGVHLIPYLDRGHYLGIDKSEELIAAGLERELGPVMQQLKIPFLRVTDQFDFAGLPQAPDFAIAQSVFTHLPPEAIRMCFQRLRRAAQEETRFFGTFYDAGTHGAKEYSYTAAQMLDFGRDHGWTARYIGDWSHPRGQVMVEYRPDGS